MTAPPPSRPTPPVAGDERSHHRRQRRERLPGRVLLAWVAVGTAALGRLPATASAHGGAGHGGTPVPFPVVLVVPVVAGLLGGVLAVGYGSAGGGSGGSGGHHPAGAALGVLLVALGGTAGVAALASDPGLAVAGASAGLLAPPLAARATGRIPWTGEGESELALGGICAHRVIEGAALPTLYAADATVGTVGVAVVAGHAALETVAVGSLFGPRRGRALAAVVLVQAGYLLGAVVGVGLGVAVPGPIQTASLGLLAGVLLRVGLAEARHARLRRRSGRVRPVE